MILEDIVDVPWHEARAATYDLALFASGYEERCTYVAAQLQGSIRRKCVLGFAGGRSATQRVANDDFFGREVVRPLISSANDEAIVFAQLRELDAREGASLRVLVDYSSMSRLWYAGVLNWCRFASTAARVTLDFVYAVGSHERDVLPMVIRDVLCVPGCEGGPLTLYKSVAVFGLGFEGLAALCVLDQLEPDVIYSFWAGRDAPPGYGEEVKRLNEEIIRQSAGSLDLPLRSVAQTYRYLAELVAPHRNNADIALVPMGPKPHVLAAMLVSMRFTDIACLRVSREDRIEPVRATGDLVCTRVVFGRKAG